MFVDHALCEVPAQPSHGTNNERARKGIKYTLSEQPAHRGAPTADRCVVHGNGDGDGRQNPPDECQPPLVHFDRV